MTIKGDSFNDWYSQLRSNITSTRLGNEMRQAARSEPPDPVGSDPVDDAELSGHLTTIYEGMKKTAMASRRNHEELREMAEEMEGTTEKLMAEMTTVLKHMMIVYGGMAFLLLLIILVAIFGGGESNGQAW